MAAFIDDEASETSNSEEEEDDDDFGPSTSRKSKTSKKSAKKSREIVDSSEEDDEDDEMDEEEMKDLINDEEEEDGEDESDDEGAGVKRSHGDDDDDEGSSSLDEDDHELIEENLGVRIDKRKKKKFRRIKMSEEDSEDENREVDEGQQISNEIFGGPLDSEDDEDVNKSRKPVQERPISDIEDEDSESDVDDFIVDEMDQPIHRKPRKKGVRYTDSAMQQAQEVFGVDFDFDEIDDEDGYEDEAYDEELDDEEEGGAPRVRQKKGNRKTIYEVYEPAELERAHMTNRDQEIRDKDEPERFQLRLVPVTSADDEEIKQEAEWIFKTAFYQPTISIQERDNEPVTGKKSEFIKTEIQYALKCIRNEKLEVPFIAAYRREYVPTIALNFDDTKDLWTIYNFDEQWCKLQSSKKKITNLYNDMREYLKSMENDRKIRPISDGDLERIYHVRTFQELEDCNLHFKLYYSPLVPEMRLKLLAKKIGEQKANKPVAEKHKVTNENGLDEYEDGQQESGENDGDYADVNGVEEQPKESDEEKLHKRLSRFKISSNKDFYHKCRLSGINDLVAKFGLSPEKFGENLRDDYQRNNVVQSYVKPNEEAASIISEKFPTADDVLKAATLMFAKEISCDPLVRRTVRKYYFENAVINVKPTTAGMREIDENHPCYAFKYLKNKPVSRLAGEQFLHLISAEKDKLLEIDISIEPIVYDAEGRRSTVSPYYESLKALYFSDFSSVVTKEWNMIREKGVKTAMDKFILPGLEKELREKLIYEAQSKIIKTCSEKLHHWLNVAPYAPGSGFDDHEEFELRNGTRICGFTFDPDGEAPCFAAIIDSEGELIDHVRLPYFHIRKRIDRMNATERENHAKDIAKFKQFMVNKKPHAVALAAETIQTKYICQELAQILDELREHDDLPLIPIEIVDNELSNVYMNLKRATEEFTDYPPLLLQAISNARKLNDPLSEYSKLCGPDDDILCIRFHSLQDDLPKDQLLTHLYQQFITVTNAVGVDPNRTLAHPHTSNIVQFISGFGPRKAAHLLRKIKKLETGGQLVSRQQLVKDLGMTSVIFMNCAGFIKLDTDSLADDYHDEFIITPLDSTRIHPESYGLAKKMASDALDYDEGASAEATANSIEEILDSPEKLEDLDLQAFARELEEVQKQGKKGFTLQSIREEFHCRYKDNRQSYKAPSQEEIFAMLTKETPATFYIGKMITCQVSQIPRKKPVASQLDMAHPVKIDETGFWRCPFCMRSDFQDLGHVWNHFDTGDCPGYAIGVKCKLDNGLFGFVPTKYLSDKEITDPSERVCLGQTIHARITKIDTDKFSCELTCRTSDLIDKDCKLKPQKDEYYDELAENNARLELEAKTKRLVRRPYCKRVIVHPAFQNIDYKVCEKKLQDMEPGQAIIRPSSAGQDFLTVSWKITNGIHHHINIREEGKDNAFSLGHQLFIENESYEDLDEIIARYIQPLASFAREILNHKYCLKLPLDVDENEYIQDRLGKEKMANPVSFPYRFCPSKKMPGKFMLGFIPNKKPKVDFLTVTPKGYRFRKLYFKNLNSLIKWFKLNWNKMPQVYPSITPGMGYEAATNPMASLRGTFPMSQ